MENRELLRVNHLKKYFQTPSGTLSAVDDVTFGINSMETLGVVGESGCGKSTLGRCILRLHEPTAGEVIFEDRNILECSKAEMKELRSKMQIIFQDPLCFPQSPHDCFSGNCSALDHSGDLQGQ